MIGGCFGAFCLGRPDWGFNPVNDYDLVRELMGGAGGGSSYCSAQGFSPVPDPCTPYVPVQADYETWPFPVPVPECP